MVCLWSACVNVTCLLQCATDGGVCSDHRGGGGDCADSRRPPHRPRPAAACRTGEGGGGRHSHAGPRLPQGAAPAGAGLAPWRAAARRDAARPEASAVGQSAATHPQVDARRLGRVIVWRVGQAGPGGRTGGRAAGEQAGGGRPAAGWHAGRERRGGSPRGCPRRQRGGG